MCNSTGHIFCQVSWKDRTRINIFRITFSTPDMRIYQYIQAHNDNRCCLGCSCSCCCDLFYTQHYLIKWEHVLYSLEHGRKHFSMVTIKGHALAFGRIWLPHSDLPLGLGTKAFGVQTHFSVKWIRCSKQKCLAALATMHNYNFWPLQWP